MVASCARPCTGAEYTWRRNRRSWGALPWGLIGGDRREGTWLRERVSSSGRWGIGCKVCAALARKTRRVPPNVAVYVHGRLRKASAVQASHLRRHAQCRFHQFAVKAYLRQPLAGDHPCAPAVSAFRKTLDHILLHRGSAHNGIPEVGQAAKVRKIILCLAEACKRMDQRFLMHAQSIALARDGRKCRLSIRFAAVDAGLRVRRGVLGLSPDFGAGGEAIARATQAMMKSMATKYEGTPHARFGQPLYDVLESKIHMITVDAAQDEILGSEMMRQPLLTSLGGTTPNLAWVLRDKAHASRRMLTTKR